METIKKLDNKITKTLKTNYIKYGLILIVLLVTINVKSLPLPLLKQLNNEFILLLIGLFIVYLVYVDIVLALVFTLSIITIIQEYNARRTVIHMNTNNTTDVDTDVIISSENNQSELNTNGDANGNGVVGTTNLAKQMASMTYTKQSMTPEFKKQIRTIAPSTYGSISETDMLIPTELKYENQIGKLDLGGVGQDMHSDADEKFQDFKKFAKVNMGQSVVTIPALEGFTNMDTSVEAKQYDHPSSKTITEMMRVQGVDYINEKNLEMIQSNNAKLGPVPCAVESICGSMNAQSF
jgi:hypothetical protein